jgi:YidC/Oxa1 family membrane protein insertase
MEKRTILAIVLSVVIIVAGMTIPGLFTKSNTSAVASSIHPSNGPLSVTTVPATDNPLATAMPLAPVLPAGAKLLDTTKPVDAFIALPTSGLSDKKLIYNNGKIVVTLDPKGAKVTSIELSDYKDHDGQVQMLFQSETGGLTTRFGGRTGQEMDDVFLLVPATTSGVFEFYRDYQLNSGVGKTIRVTKTYTFTPKDYVFNLDVKYEYSANEFLPSFGDNAFYTLSLGPQIGPLSSKINNSQDYRNFVYLTGDSRQQPGVGPGTDVTLKDRPKWLAVDGKYFVFFLVPPNADSQIVIGNHSLPNGVQGNQVHFSRNAIQSARFEDSWHFYAGPKIASILDSYNRADDNPSKMQDTRFDKLAGDNILGWLENILKAIMQWFTTIIPNWGVAIILLTILVKLLLFPLSHKAAKSTFRMQALQPRITALREKYKANPQKMNQEMAAIYKKEKINPLGGCLPLLLQFPFFFAMYSLFNNQFDLRGAMFIPGWINDLSQPETVLHFSFNLPVIGTPITGLHLLPIFYLISQIVTSRITQTIQPGSSTGQMKFMMYGLPAVFFFILYEVPSGLLVYWIFQNILQLGQQLLVNRMLRKNPKA